MSEDNCLGGPSDQRLSAECFCQAEGTGKPPFQKQTYRADLTTLATKPVTPVPPAFTITHHLFHCCLLLASLCVPVYFLITGK